MNDPGLQRRIHDVVCAEWRVREAFMLLDSFKDEPQISAALERLSEALLLVSSYAETLLPSGADRKAHTLALVRANVSESD